ncbi:hypothetical protein ABMA28_011417 [Loxostege sticticalis]|uniref:Reverse transcriptase domain-containing protein n=1 Tax=Loxostege sticticalis TaxID=481309 RepID=A0ABD0S5M4_LOXSC
MYDSATVLATLLGHCLQCCNFVCNSVDNLLEFIDCLSAVSAIVDEYGSEAVFILGDFNADPGELFYSELCNICNDQLWSCIDTELLGLDSGTFTFISDVYGTCSWLDHCITSQSAKHSVTDVDVLYDTQWSDHFPLLVHCDLKLLAPKILPKIINANKDIVWGERSVEQINMYTSECHNRLRLIDFPSDCVNCANRACQDRSHWQTLDTLYADIVTALRDAAVVSRGSRKGGRSGSRVVGWNKHVSAAHREARSKLHEWRMCGKPKSGCVYQDMRESRRVFKSRLKWCQDHQEQIKIASLAEMHSKGNFKGFWKSTNKINVRPGLPVSVDGVNDPREIANVFKNHFSVKSPLGPAEEALNKNVNNQVAPMAFLAKNVSKAIKSISRGKSPGHDGLSIEHLQYAGPHITRVLAMFYSLCVSHSYLPVDFMKTVVVPVVKNKTGDLTDKTNYRPISLATVIAKVFDGLLNAQLNEYVTLNDNQFGFRPRLSTESAILCFKHTVKYYTNRKTPVHACFLDLSKAFDLVQYDRLWDKLRSINLPEELISVFQYWYLNQSNSVRWAGAVSDPYRLECGVRQGGLTSPTLFNLYMNDLIVSLGSQRVGCYVDGVCVNNLSYADDMVLLSASICGLRKLIRICEEYASGHGLKYNVKKSKSMVFKAGTKCPKDLPPVLLNSVPLEVVDQFKYLGHVITHDLKDNADIERERRSLSVRANMIARRFARCSQAVKITLFRAYCTSLYACSLWADYNKRTYSDIRILYNNAFRVIVGLPRFCSASGMFAEARTACFQATMRKRCVSMVRRVRASSNVILKAIGDRLDCPFLRHCCDRHVPAAAWVRCF